MASAGKRRKPNEQRVTLAVELVIGNAPALHAQLCEAVAQAAPVVLDAGAVTRLDAAGLQLLQAFVHTCGERTRTWRWENVGEPLREGAALLGLQQMLELPDAAPANV